MINDKINEIENLQKLTSNQRREKILDLLAEADKPLSATIMASMFGVSRQIIVGDIALLRASGLNISATSKGYVYIPDDSDSEGYGFIGMIACKHSEEQLIDELYTIVDFGGCLLDVTIEHPIYGQISGKLNICSRYEAGIFSEKIKDCNAKQLCDLTDGTHFHRIGCKDESIFQHIINALTQKGIAIE
ncbi:transcription repressor NadR [Anaerovorax odorimutans]|uniref:transcription repressor NadR n=1 Tax=Anaerovorax odorimutans TaxID=109327 RepID=UPI00040AC763|nr:transcription repressor NadR [Anaerovorax odorimutans]